MDKHPKMGQQWVFSADIESQIVAENVKRKVLAFSKELMCVENHLATGAIGAVHSHPHTQITYVVSGRFLFTIGDAECEVGPGDTLLKEDGVLHGCLCMEKGVLLDVFTPMREDFL